jgi:acyl carrier protein
MARLDRTTDTRGGQLVNGLVWEQVAGIAADVLGVEKSSLDRNSGPEQIEAWDSVEHLNLVMALESHFSLQFDPEEMDRMTTLGRMAEIVEARAGGTRAG